MVEIGSVKLESVPIFGFFFPLGYQRLVLKVKEGVISSAKPPYRLWVGGI